MFSFFKRNKPRSNNETENNKLSVNIQSAIERQQASLQKVLDQKLNKNDVNDREQKDSHNSNEDRHSINKSATLPAIVGEINKSNVLPTTTSVFGARALKNQNYDQHRDSKRATYSTFDHFVASKQGGSASVPAYSQQASSSFFPSSSPSPSTSVTVVASSINDHHHLRENNFDFSPIAGTDSDIQFDEVMGKGRNNRNRNNKNFHIKNNNNNNNKNVVKNNNNKCDIVPSSIETINRQGENSFKAESDEETHKNASLIKTHHDDVYSENSASISNEKNVLHDDDDVENSCSIFKAKVAADNTNDNITASNEEKIVDDVKCSGGDEVTNKIHASTTDHHHHQNDVNVKNDDAQQVGEPLQRNSSSKRVHFAPSPPSHHKVATTESTSSSDESEDDEESEEEETISSEDIFYEAEAPNELQKLKILSTVTSHQSSDCNRIDEEENAENDTTLNCESSSSLSSSISNGSNNNNSNNNNNNDVVCAKIILSVNENDIIKSGSDNHNNNNNNVDNDNERVDIRNVNAFSSNDDSTCSTTSASEENSISNDDDDRVVKSDVPKTIKPSYMLVGDDPILLPDIVALPDILLEQQQQQHINVDEVANISHASSYVQHGNSMSSNQVEIVDQMQLKVNELCMKIDELEIELNIKAGTVDRLQSELECANKEGECVRRRLLHQNEQLERVKEKHDLDATDEQRKYAILEKQYKDSVTKLQKMQNLASNLNVQLAQASVDIEKLRMERDELLDKLTMQEKLLRDILETATEEREQTAAKWKHQFEQLRNVNCSREETLMEDCEWKLRQMMKQCKEKFEKIEKEKLSLKDQAQIDRQTIRSQRDEIRNLKAAEKEANQLRGLTNDQKDSISTMMKRIEDMRSEMDIVKKKLQAEIDSCAQIKRDCSFQLSERERSATNRIEIARGEVAMEWEGRLMEEMGRLKMELEQVHIEDRNIALNELKAEHLEELQAIATKYKKKEEALVEDIATLRAQLDSKQEDLRNFQSKADMQLIEQRVYIERRERDHQKELDKQQKDFERQLRLHSDLIEEIKDEHKREKEQIKASFHRSLEQIKEEFANEITLATETLQAKHKKEMEEQWKQLVHEKESALQAAENRLRIKMEDADNKLSSIMTKHQRQLNDVHTEFDIQRSRLETRDVQNSQEIDTLHRKCICLTKLFEEMRIRYERRDPRPEDIRRIDELKSIVDSQERDIYSLTEKLRELQLQYQNFQQTQNQQINQQNSNQSNKRNKGKNNCNSNNNNNKINRGNLNNAPQMRQHQQQQQQNNSSEQQQQSQQNQPQQRMRPPPLIKTVIYEEENEDELYEEQLREERENAARQSEPIEIPHTNHIFTVELVPESPDYLSKNGNSEEISEALIVPEHEVKNERVIPSPTPDDFKNQEISVEVISTIEPSHFQVIPLIENGLDLELD